MIGSRNWNYGVLFILLLALPGAALGQAKDERARAEELFKEGNGLYREGQFDKALMRLKAAYALFSSPLFFYNIGLCHEKLGQAVEAMEAYRSYLRELPDSRDRGEVQGRITALEGKILARLELTSEPGGASMWLDDSQGCKAPCTLQASPGKHLLRAELDGYETETMTLEAQASGSHPVAFKLRPAEKQAKVTLVVEPVGASVMVNGKVVGKTPLAAPLTLSAGVHRLALEAAGHMTWEEEVTVEAKRDIEKEVRLLPLEGDQGMSGLRVAAWSTAGVAVAAAVGGAVLAGLTVMAQSDLESVQGPAVWSEEEGVLTRGEGYQTGSIILFSTAAAAAVASTVLFLVEPSRERALDPLAQLGSW